MSDPGNQPEDVPTQGHREGGCQCGKVRYRVGSKPLAVAVCHCGECQRQSGSAFAMSMIVPDDSFELLSGDLKSFSRSPKTGITVDCHFCPDCGSRIYHLISSMPGTVSIKPGTLDDTSWLNPNFHVWTQNKQSWVSIPEGPRSFETQPE